MMYYYDINALDEFDTLFKNPTKNKNNYYILKFDFSGITTANQTIEELEKEFTDKVILGIKEYLNKYEQNYNVDETTKT